MIIITAVASVVGALLFFFAGLLLAKKGGQPTSAGNNAEADALRGQLFEVEQARVSAESQVQQLGAQLNQFKQGAAANAGLQKELQAARADAARLENELREAKASSTITMSSDLATNTEEVPIQGELAELRAERDDLKAALAKTATNLGNASEMHSRLERALAENAALREEVTHARGGGHGGPLQSDDTLAGQDTTQVPRLISGIVKDRK